MEGQAGPRAGGTSRAHRVTAAAGMDGNRAGPHAPCTLDAGTALRPLQSSGQPRANHALRAAGAQPQDKQEPPPWQETHADVPSDYLWSIPGLPSGLRRGLHTCAVRDPPLWAGLHGGTPKFECPILFHVTKHSSCESLFNPAKIVAQKQVGSHVALRPSEAVGPRPSCVPFTTGDGPS